MCFGLGRPVMAAAKVAMAGCPAVVASRASPGGPPRRCRRSPGGPVVATPGWRPAHVLALAGGAVMANAVFGFFVQPLGDSPLALKLAHNVVLAVGMVALPALGARVVRRAQDEVDVTPNPVTAVPRACAPRSG